MEYMDYMRAAKQACLKGGTVDEFSAAISSMVSVGYGIGPDTWDMFSILAFLAGNIPVLEHILGEDMFSWPEQLTRMEQSLSEHDAAHLLEYKADIERRLNDRICSIAREVFSYQGAKRANLISTLKDRQHLRHFAAIKATECYNTQMLKDVLDLIVPLNILEIPEHSVLYNRIVLTINGMTMMQANDDAIAIMRDVIKESFGVEKPWVPIARVEKKRLTCK